jgi:hypothetical protein
MAGRLIGEQCMSEYYVGEPPYSEIAKLLQVIDSVTDEQMKGSRDEIFQPVTRLELLRYSLTSMDAITALTSAVDALATGNPEAKSHLARAHSMMAEVARSAVKAAKLPEPDNNSSSHGGGDVE